MSCSVAAGATALLLLLIVLAPPTRRARRLLSIPRWTPPDSNPGDGLCDDGLRRCTFRAAIQERTPKPTLRPSASRSARAADDRAGECTPNDHGTRDDLDGTTQSGSDGSPIIELNGASAGLGATGSSSWVGPTTVRGLVINRFLGRDRRETLGDRDIEGNYIGVGLDGSMATANSAGSRDRQPVRF